MGTVIAISAFLVRSTIYSYLVKVVDSTVLLESLYVIVPPNGSVSRAEQPKGTLIKR